MLRELPIQQIKIDRSFIIDFNQSEANRTIIYALIRLAKDLRLSVVAEGVEGYDVEEALVSLGCTYLQGYLYSKPISLGDLLTQINVQPGANLYMVNA
ncbi:EAL domain-containing protein [Vibrio sp. PP-XX7]